MENKYWIGKSSITGNVVLFTGNGCGFYIHAEDSYQVYVGEFQKLINQKNFKNITADYLRNTKIRIVSPEHSAFVQKLVFGAGGGWGFGHHCLLDGLDFLFISEVLRINKSDSESLFNHSSFKEIKLPMPPSQLPEVSSETPMPKVKQPKGSGLNLNPNCVLNPIHDGLNNCKVNEWPKVGDEVLICETVQLFDLHRFNGEKCRVIGICNNGDERVLTLIHDKLGLAALNMGKWIKKPPTHQEKLTNEIYNQIGSKDDSYALAKAILAGEIEGLVYRGD